MEFGLYTFADIGKNPVTGEITTPAMRLNQLVEEIALADELGIDVFGLGEHHRDNYAVSHPAIALAAAAPRTKNIKLSSAVTVLSSDDPVRVYEQYSMLDNLTEGRAEIMAGRGSFIESFPLFGYDLNDYNELFSEKLQMLIALNDQGEHVSWPGSKFTQKIDNRGLYPRPFNDKLPIWIAVGGTPQSVVRAASLGLPLALAIIGGEPARFAPFFELYDQALEQAGKNPREFGRSLNVHGFVGETSKEARDIFYPAQAEVMNQIARERGFMKQNRAAFDASCGPTGAMFVGSPSEVAEKILSNYEVFGGFDRILIQMGIGVYDHKELLKATELYATRVIPEVKKALSLKQ